jgi:thioredoxin 1
MANANVATFTTENWDQEVVNSNQLVVVDFWAPWCGPCRALSPTIDKLADRYAGEVKVGKLNVDEAPDVAAQFGVNSIPRIMLFKGGSKPVREFAGVQSEQVLSDAITKALRG